MEWKSNPEAGPVPRPAGPADAPEGTSGRCVRPVWAAVTAPKRVIDPSEIRLATRDAWQYVRCRKCAECKKERKRMWIARAIEEVRQAPVTWLFTGTFSCEPPDQEAVKREAVRFWKRLRKGRAEPVQTFRGPIAVPPVKVRFLQVVEHGEKNGRLHLHALVHGDGDMVRWLQLRTAWHAGYMHARRIALSPDGTVSGDVLREIAYVAGYLYKQQGRVISSVRYGRRNQPTKGGDRSERSPVSPHKDEVAQQSA